MIDITNEDLEVEERWLQRIGIFEEREEPCEDDEDVLISRNAVIKLMHGVDYDFTSNFDYIALGYKIWMLPGIKIRRNNEWLRTVRLIA